ncbi:adenylate cyclase-associated CAP [Ramicandelaber brevisporus]|nr:adenylate cyclase-associated CAP [Ramicandelaber brevisporus]
MSNEATLSTLLKRLEAATARLEDIASARAVARSTANTSSKSAQSAAGANAQSASTTTAAAAGSSSSTASLPAAAAAAAAESETASATGDAQSKDIDESAAASADSVVSAANDASEPMDIIEHEVTGVASAGSEQSSATAGATAAAAVDSDAESADAQADIPFPDTVVAFDEQIVPHLKAYGTLSEQVGDVVLQHCQLVREIMIAQREFLYIASYARKPGQSPSDPVYTGLLKATQQAITSACEFRETNRRSKLYNMLSTVAEGVPCFGWVVIQDSGAASYVRDMKDAATYYAHRVIKEAKGSNETYVQWANSFIKLVDAVAVYVAKVFPNGLTWNDKDGLDPQLFVDKSFNEILAIGARLHSDPSAAPAAPAAPSAPSVPSAPSAPPAAVPVAPPPPPPMSAEEFNKIANDAPKDSAPKQSSATALFSEINKSGSNITSGLRHVERSQMTHKNPELRAGGVVAPSAKSDDASSVAPKRTAAASKRGPPKLELLGNRWKIENYSKPGSPLVVEITDFKQTLMIADCDNTVVHVKGKLNGITILSCIKTSVLVESVIAAVEVAESKSVEVQITGVAPSIMIDKVDGCQLYLSRETVDQVVITTAKSSEMNINFPENDKEDADYIEKPIPEIFQSRVVDGKIVTKPVEHV